MAITGPAARGKRTYICGVSFAFHPTVPQSRVRSVIRCPTPCELDHILSLRQQGQNLSFEYLCDLLNRQGGINHLKLVRFNHSLKFGKQTRLVIYKTLIEIG